MSQCIDSGLGGVSYCCVQEAGTLMAGTPFSAPTPVHIPKNSTQLISISSLSPSAHNGRSSSRLRSTNGPVSGAECCLLFKLAFSGSIFGRACAQTHIIAYLRQVVLAGAHPGLPRRNLWMLVGGIWRRRLSVYWCGAGISFGYGENKSGKHFRRHHV